MMIADARSSWTFSSVPPRVARVDVGPGGKVPHLILAGSDGSSVRGRRSVPGSSGPRRSATVVTNLIGLVGFDINRLWIALDPPCCRRRKRSDVATARMWSGD